MMSEYPSARVAALDSTSDARWDAFVENHPRGTLFHGSCWRNILQDTFRYEPAYSIVEDERGSIRGGFPLFWIRSLVTGSRLVSLPFTDSCDILARSDDDFRELLNAAKESEPGNASGFLRVCVKEPGVDLARFGFEVEHRFKNHVLTVDRDPEEILGAAVDRTRRANVRTAQRAGIEVAPGVNDRDLDDFYRMYVTTRKKLGLLPMPRAFYKNLWDSLILRGMGHLLVARMDSVPVASMLFLRDRRTLYAVNSGSLEKYLSCRPNDLLWWEGIRLAAKEGLRFFDFGRTAEDNRGLLFYKRQWGTVEHDIVHLVLRLKNASRAPAAGRSRIDSIRKVVRRTPDALVRLGGRLLYRHFG